MVTLQTAPTYSSMSVCNAHEQDVFLSFVSLKGCSFVLQKKLLTELYYRAIIRWPNIAECYYVLLSIMGICGCSFKCDFHGLRQRRNSLWILDSWTLPNEILWIGLEGMRVAIRTLPSGSGCWAICELPWLRRSSPTLMPDPACSQSIVRVVFHDRRLQYMEHQQLEGWRWNRPGDRILDIGECDSTRRRRFLLIYTRQLK